MCVCVRVCRYGTVSKGKVRVDRPLKFAAKHCLFVFLIPPKPAVKSAALLNLQSCFQIDTLPLDPSSPVPPSPISAPLCHLFEQSETTECTLKAACVQCCCFIFSPLFSCHNPRLCPVSYHYTTRLIRPITLWHTGVFLHSASAARPVENTVACSLRSHFSSSVPRLVTHPSPSSLLRPRLLRVPFRSRSSLCCGCPTCC